MIDIPYRCHQGAAAILYLFPNNHSWSQAALRALFTGGAPGEVLEVVGALTALPEADQTDDAWCAAWSRVGERLRDHGLAARAAGHRLTAASSLKRAATYDQFAIAFADPRGPRRAELHRRSLDSFAAYAALREPAIQAVEVPYLDGSFPAWYVPPLGAAEGTRPPAVFYLPGWDSTKEQGIELALEVAARGIGVLLCDGPGIGEAVAFRGLVNRHDYEVVGSAAFDALAARPDVDPQRIGVVGSSLGGYRAARVAAFEHRLAAAVIWGAIWNFGTMWRRSLAAPGMTLPTRNAHALHVMGAADLDEVTRLTEAWDLAPVAAQIRAPLLVLHGERDIQVPTEDAQRLHDVASSTDKELKIFTVEEGGAAHCQNDNRLLAHEYIGDWLADRLVRS
jgi:dipeptidyl aminopeptidase/acylaminoacyl peptidase